MLIEFLDKRLIAGWRVKIRKLWTVRLTALFCAAYAIVTVWPAADGMIPKGAYIAIGLISHALVFIARVTKQPGIDE